MTDLISMISKDFPHVNAVCIEQHGKSIVKEYYNGHKDNETYKVACIFKNIVSALVGIALKEGKIHSLEQKLLEYYPNDSSPEMDPFFASLTLHHAMTKTSGLIWPDPGEKITLLFTQ